MNVVKRLCLLLLFTPASITGFGQQRADTALVKHSPKKATLLSTFLPGAGQVYNGKYWKVPVIYGGFALLVYSVSFYDTEYNRFRVGLNNKRAGQPTGDVELEPLSEDVLLSVRESYRESRDFNVILCVGMYALQILDAAVDAHLREFNVSDKLSLNWQPQVFPLAGQPIGGLRIGLTIK